ncbi:hypothetical protein ACOME3_007440 [Neoechinorhynchus agilis]
MLIRIRAPHGQLRRVQVPDSAKIGDLYELATREIEEGSVNGTKYPLTPDTSILYLDSMCTTPLDGSATETPVSFLFSNGDLVYTRPYVISSSSPIIRPSQTKLPPPEPEDDLDRQLESMDIEQTVPTISCPFHSSSGKCSHCAGKDVLGEDYLMSHDPPIKHLSFYAYLRKLRLTNSDKLLEEPECAVKTNCSNHAPWPQAICSRCQPPSMTLSRQTYRHVDNVMFENGDIADRFIDYWRSTGEQRVGLLYGHYEYYDNVPLGIRAVVKVIYEPPQMANQDYIEIDPDSETFRSDVSIADELASELNMRCIGWIFTDLVISKRKRLESTSGVEHFRGGNIDSHFLTAQECIMAAYFQNQHRNACRRSSTGVFGSRFVTVIVTGDESNNIHFEGYQVSNQCAALVRADIIVPTIDVPELAYIKSSTKDKFVPDVFYIETDEFGNKISKEARPLPVEYLLIDVPAAFAVTPTRTFNPTLPESQKPVCFNVIENRQALYSTTEQVLQKAGEYIDSFPHELQIHMFSDFHFLFYLVRNPVAPLSIQSVRQLIKVLRVNDDSMRAAQLHSWVDTHGDFRTLVQVCQMSERSTSSQLGLASSQTQVNEMWFCPLCTFQNSNSTICEMCQSPRTVDAPAFEL